MVRIISLYLFIKFHIACRWWHTTFAESILKLQFRYNIITNEVNKFLHIISLIDTRLAANVEESFKIQFPKDLITLKDGGRDQLRYRNSRFKHQIKHLNTLQSANVAPHISRFQSDSDSDFISHYGILVDSSAKLLYCALQGPSETWMYNRLNFNSRINHQGLATACRFY